jgi:hypothetical protein
MDVEKLLKDAWKAVEESGMPESLYETAFNRAVDLLAGPAVAQPPIVPPAAQTSPPPPGPGVVSPPPPPAPPAGGQGGSDEDNFYAKLTKETEVVRRRLESVVHLDENVPKMAINPKKLPSGKKAGQEFIARVILTARHLWLDEAETPIAEVRNECERYGVLDGNFAKYMKGMDDPGLTQIGSGHSLKVKVRKNYISDFGGFLNQSIGADDSVAST